MSSDTPAGRTGTGFARMYGHFRVPGGSEHFYDRVCELMNFPATIAPGMLGHFAGPIEIGWEVIDIWRENEAMEHTFSQHLVDAISSAIEQTGERFDVEPEMREIARVVLGPAANNHRLDDGADRKCSERGVRPVGVVIDSPAGDLDGYLRTCEHLNFPDDIPAGLVVHLAGECEGGWRIFDCWDSDAQCDDFMRKVLEAIDVATGGLGRAEVNRFDLTRAFLSPLLTGGGYLPA